MNKIMQVFYFPLMAGKVKRYVRSCYYPRRSRSAIGVDIVFTLDVCLYVCMLAL